MTSQKQVNNSDLEGAVSRDKWAFGGMLVGGIIGLYTTVTMDVEGSTLIEEAYQRVTNFGEFTFYFTGLAYGVGTIKNWVSEYIRAQEYLGPPNPDDPWPTPR